ncbi:YybH family protein [Saccharothrix deserti]|uniref:YybH family protein n=1 Tax=Saccharothrix deserti TaxID=2593674 RepID=UPI00131C6468|nr:nuclear transport factor 2 family protein [Saccharothrix deserti]
MSTDSETIIELTDDVDEHLELYVRAFNSGNAEALNRLYTEEAVAVWEPGEPLTGRAREEYVAGFLATGPRMTAKMRHSYVTGDTALLVVDWTMESVGEDGERLTTAGIGLDVLRLGEDGKWRYAVDDPYGESHPYGPGKE